LLAVEVILAKLPWLQANFAGFFRDVHFHAGQ